MKKEKRPNLYDEQSSPDRTIRIVARLLLDLNERCGCDLGNVDDECLQEWFDHWKKIVQGAEV